MIHRPFMFAVLLTAICLLLSLAVPAHGQVAVPRIQNVPVICGFNPEVLVADALGRGQTEVHTVKLATASGSLVAQIFENPETKTVTVLAFASKDNACTVGVGSFTVDRPKESKKQL